MQVAKRDYVLTQTTLHEDLQMTEIKFCCPNCAFDMTISENEIPQTATQCKCPNCKELLSLSQAFTKLKSAVSSSIDQTIEAWFENIQSDSFKETGKESESSSRYLDLINKELSLLFKETDKESGSSSKYLDLISKELSLLFKETEKESESSSKYLDLVDKGLSLLDKENILEAMLLLEEAERLDSTPKVRSYLAYCRAKENQDYSNALKMCMNALREEPTIADHYFNLGRIYLLINKKGAALQAFQKGIKLGPNPKLMQELRKFEKRKPPVFSSLPREHWLNRELGKLLSRLGLR